MTDKQKRVKPKWLTLAMFATTIVCMTSCISSKNFRTQTLIVKSNPDASIFWSDGSKAQTKYGYHIQVKSWGLKYRLGTDSLGNGLVRVSKHEYKKKGGKIIIAKPGYEPQEFKLKWNLKKTQTFMLSKPAQYHAHDYLSLAHEATSQKKRMELFRAAMFQDPENDEGVGLLAANALTRWKYLDKDYTEALAYAQSALKMDPQDSTVQANFQAINQAIYAKAEKAMRRSQRLQQYNQNAQAWLQWGREMSAQFSNQPASSSISETSGSSSKTKGSKKKSTTENVNLGNYRASNGAYSGYSDDLHKMQAGTLPYNDSNRRKMQSKMRQLREDWNSKHPNGLKIAKDPIEDWGGK